MKSNIIKYNNNLLNILLIYVCFDQRKLEDKLLEKQLKKSILGVKGDVWQLK